MTLDVASVMARTGTMKDSGERQKFGDGRAVRDSAEGKAPMSLLAPAVWRLLPVPYGHDVADYLMYGEVMFLQRALGRMLELPGAWERLCEWLRQGAAKYERFNWAKGMPFSRCLDSLGRHLLALYRKQDDEDHLAAAMCNLMFLIHYHEAVDKGYLPRELDDRFVFDRVAHTPLKTSFDIFPPLEVVSASTLSLQ